MAKRRPSGDGMVRKREDGRWEGRIVIGHILPAPLLKVLKQYRKTCTSRWMFPSPKKEDSPLDPAAVRKKLAAVLERAGCKHLRFHDLRHTFATNALEHGMDIKTLSAIIGQEVLRVPAKASEENGGRDRG